MSSLILLVDDDTQTQQIMVRMVQALGHTVFTVPNGWMAMRALAQMRYDLILMDCLMPEMDGFVAAQAIRRHEHGSQRTPIVAITAASSADIRDRCLRAGMDDMLPKPVDHRALDQTICYWLSHALPAPERQRDVREDDTVIDMAQLDKLRVLQRHNHSIIAECIAGFLEEAPEQIEQLRDAVLAGNSEGVYFSAHKLKSTSAMLGAQTLARFCRQLEDMGRDGDIGAAKHVLPGMLLHFADVVARMEQIRLAELHQAATSL